MRKLNLEAKLDMDIVGFITMNIDLMSVLDGKFKTLS